mmetsp:Transcript_56357/g.123481  ORF Transcript_56357/g.123481 Transcript_56357/m.123481 type:complete len:244 (-) Transcript_56357:111-842(-)
MLGAPVPGFPHPAGIGLCGCCPCVRRLQPLLQFLHLLRQLCHRGLRRRGAHKLHRGRLGLRCPRHPAQLLSLRLQLCGLGQALALEHLIELAAHLSGLCRNCLHFVAVGLLLRAQVVLPDADFLDCPGHDSLPVLQLVLSGEKLVLSCQQLFLLLSPFCSGPGYKLRGVRRDQLCGFIQLRGRQGHWCRHPLLLRLVHLSHELLRLMLLIIHSNRGPLCLQSQLSRGRGRQLRQLVLGRRDLF